MICHLVQTKCMIKSQAGAPVVREDHGEKPEVQLAMEKHREFEEMSHSAASLQKLTVFVIRQNVRDKTEENFAQLELPACQLN